MSDLKQPVPTVYLHIGAPKTATSTLQSVFANNTPKLLKSGVLYPQSMRSADAHHVLACDLIEKYQGNRMSDVWYGDVPRGEGWSLLRREIEQCADGIDSVVVSTELLFGQTRQLPAMLDEVANHLDGFAVKVVVYLRRQDQLYSSFYNQDVKGMRQWTSNAYEFYQTHQMFRTDYHQRLGMWGEAFGKQNIILRPFEAGQWPDGDIVRDFCSCLGIEPLSSRYDDKNESLGVTQLYIKRCLNRVGFDKSQNDRVVNVLTTLCPEEPVKNCLYVHRGLYGDYRDGWEDVNNALSRDYLAGRPLFEEPIPKPGELELYEMDKGLLAHYVSCMMSEFGWGKYPEYRELFARATLLALAESSLWDSLDVSQRQALLEWV